MLLTPRIVRGHELTQEDVSPIHIGTPGSIGLTGPPARIAVSAGPQTAPEVAAADQPPSLTRTPNADGLPLTAAPSLPPGPGTEPARDAGQR